MCLDMYQCGPWWEYQIFQPLALLYALGVLGENHNLDLVTLISWLEESQKFCKILHKFLQSLAMAFVKRKTSFAKNKCERCVPYP